MMMRMYLIRHGQTDWNFARRYQGHTNIDLNAAGVRQARLCAVRLAKEKIDKAYSSDSLRAINFARIALEGRVIEKLAALREMNFGIWEGLTYEESMREFPDIYSRWINDPYSIAVPEGEQFEAFTKRVLGAFEHIVCANGYKTIAVFTHSGPIRVMLNQYLKSDNMLEIKTYSVSIHMI
ncbi:MAG: histidine phosphatase family protein [Candidatus Omnitrophica bacterium]|nr:histidine phosphatase family protein [Candidatus Omnitrophota bacterium]